MIDEFYNTLTKLVTSQWRILWYIVVSDSSDEEWLAHKDPFYFVSRREMIIRDLHVLTIWNLEAATAQLEPDASPALLVTALVTNSILFWIFQGQNFYS